MNSFLRNRGRGPTRHWICSALVMFALALFLTTGAKAAGLSGTYTVCASGCNYSSPASAMSALSSQGVSGPVTFNVSAGTYSGTGYVYSITGASSTNTITFNGAGMNNTIMTSSSSYVLYMSGSKYVTFQNMQFNFTSSGECLYLNSITNCTFDHCRIIAPSYSSPSYIFSYNIEAFYLNTCTFSNNRMEGGYYGCLAEYCTTNKFLNNRIVGFYYAGMYIYNYGYTGQDVVSNNSMDSSAYAYGPYGILAYYENGGTFTNNVLNNCGMEMYYPNYTSTTVLADINNNIINAPNYAYSYPFQIYIYNSNVRIAHNTVYLSPSNSAYYGVYIYNSSSSGGVSVMDNIFDIEGTASYYSVYITGSATNYAKLDGNDYFTGSTSGGLTSVNVLGTGYTSYSSLYSALTSKGFETYSSNIKPTYVSVTKNDFHLNQSTPNPAGVYAGVDKDIDGDARCKLFPSAGADESNYGKTTKPTAKFFGPTTIYNGAPTIFYNTAKAGTPQIYRWYVNGKYVTDSLHLKTQLALYPSVTIALKVTNCAGSDSTSQTFSVAYPAAAPVSDFIADKNSIKVGDVVRFTDLSTNGANSWQWTITPDSTFSFGAKIPTYKYIFGSNTAQNPQIQFLSSGYYKVCLTASNVLSGGKVGKGNTVCKTNYIYVLPSINLGSQTSTREPKGYIYDDGGPNGNYYSTTSYPKPTVQGLLIDACADSTYLVFQTFGTYCGYDYVKVFDGKDNSGKSLLKSKCSSGSAPSTSVGYFSNGPGYNGGGSYSGCTYQCLPNLTTSTGTIDTFKAGKQMYVEMDMYPGLSNPGLGFSAYYWTKPRTEPKPKANFTTSVSAHHDSICAGGVITFTNTTTGNDLTYQWELDGDYSDGFETTTQNASWLWLFPTEAPVTLIATNCGGPDTITKTIHVFAPASPVASFKADNTNPTITDLVFLTSTVPQCVDDYKWTVVKTYASTTDTGHAQFAMGTTATNANPVLMFTDTGYYSVTLFVDNGGGAAKDQITKTAYIYVKAGYCVPSVAQLNAGIGITNVSFNGINNKTSQGVTDYTNFVNNGNLSTTLELGVSYPISISRDTPYYEAITRTIFIDWNRNGSFESNERVAVDSNDTRSATWRTSIKVPKTASIGATVMRIAANRGSYTNQPCGQNQYGEYEDYRIYVRPDQTPPVIYLKGKDSIMLEQGYTFVEPGDSAWDNLNGNITANITRTSSKPNSFKINGPALIPGNYTIAYNVSDSTGNPAVTKYRHITVLPDTARPNLQVAGPDTTFVLVNKSSSAFVTLPAVLSSDDLVDGTTVDTISPQNIPVNKLDTVKVMYSTSDQTGNRAVVYRYVIVYDNVAPVLTIVGKQTQYVEVGSTYTDSGVTTSDNYYTSSQLDGMVQKTNNVDMSKLGTYTITYMLTDPSGNKATPVTRTVNVVDTAAPSITLNGNKSDTIEVYSIYNDKGVTTSDNYYTTVTVTRTGTYYSNFANGKATKLGAYTIIYTAMDGSGNKASVTRFVTVVDRIAPVIKLLGDPAVAVCRWFDYVDSGYTVSDNYYTKVTVDTEGTFLSQGRTTIQGLYSLRYKAIDGSGNVSYSAYRYILVRPADDQLCKTGIKEGLSLDKYINVYPNPTSGMLNITANLPNPERVVMTITNALGQTVATVSNGNLNQNSFSIDLSGQATGMYMLTIQTAHDRTTKQIMLTK